MLKTYGQKYQEDAKSVSHMSRKMLEAANTMSVSISEVNGSIIQVASTTKKSTSNSEEILLNISQATTAVEEVSKQAQSTSELAEKLATLTHKFKIND